MPKKSSVAVGARIAGPAPQITPPPQAETPNETEVTAEVKIPNVVEELRKAREAAEAELAAQTAPKEEPAETGPDPAIVEWLSQATVSGTLLSSSTSKMILNGTTYANGDYVNPQLGLRVMVIQEKRILFVDDKGQKYMKRL